MAARRVRLKHLVENRLLERRATATPASLTERGPSGRDKRGGEWSWPGKEGFIRPKAAPRLSPALTILENEMTDLKLCGSCTYFLPVMVDGVGDSHGECHRHAPSATHAPAADAKPVGWVEKFMRSLAKKKHAPARAMSPCWPVCDKDDFCGDYSPHVPATWQQWIDSNKG